MRDNRFVSFPGTNMILFLSAVWLVCALILCIYALLLVFLCLRPVHPAPQKRDTESLPAASIVIPFKNEAQNLTALLHSLEKQTCPAPFEVILVNDGSSDDYPARVEPFLNRRNLQLTVVDTRFDPGAPCTSKQQALETGAALAAHPWLVFTDADMVLEPHWLQSLMHTAAAGNDFVFGHTIISNRPSTFFGGLQAAQLEFLFCVAYAFHYSGLCGSCMGNNVAVSRAVYDAVGGQRGLGYEITEDWALYCACRKKKFRVSPVAPFIPTAVTFPVLSATGFVRQSMRWALGGIHAASGLLPAALCTIVQNGTVALGSAGLLPAPLTILSLVNVLLTALFFHRYKNEIRSPLSTAWFLPLYLFFILQTLLFPFAIFLRPHLRWKGTRI